MIEEMDKLRKALDDKGIAWWDESDDLIDRTKFEINGVRWSAINGLGTYGGIVNGSDHNQGLLEVWNNSIEEIGWLTAYDVIQMVSNVENNQC